MLYVYAIARSSLDTTPIHGLDDRPVQSIEGSGLAALVTRHDYIELEPTPKFAWAHQGVVEQLGERADVLPMRIATTVPDENGVVEMLVSREQEFRRALDRVAGAIEFGVRAMRDAEAPEPAAEPVLAGEGPGTAYLRGRLARRRSQAALRDDVLEPLRPYARAVTLRPGGESAEVQETLAVAYLVDRDAASVFTERVAELDRTLDATRVLCTGPWPPYSFVDPARPA